MTAKASTTTDREIVLTRTFEAPRDLVFKAYTERDHIDKWWGPNGFTTTTYEMDVRPGGVWRFTMHGPDGTDYPNFVRYTEVVPPSLLRYDHGESEDDPAEFQVTVTFAEEAGRTTITSRMVFPTTEDRDEKVGFGAVELGNQTMARLEDYMASMM